LTEEEAKGAHRHDDGTDGQFLDPQQMQKIGVDLVVSDLVRRTVVELG